MTKDEDIDKLVQALRELPEEKRKEVQEKMNEEPDPPRVGWSTDPLRLKAALKRLAGEKDMTRRELADYLTSVDEIREVTSMHFGLVGRKSNSLFEVEKRGEKAEDKISLTRSGEELETLFDDDISRLTPHEKALYRGLHQYGNQYVFLSILEEHRKRGGDEDGILKEELQEKMEDIYGKSAQNFTGYYGTLFSRLGLIERNKDGRKARYKLAIPSEW